MWKSLGSLWPYLRKYRGGLALGIGSLLVKDALAAGLPIVIKYGVDSLTRGFQLRTVLQLAALLIGLSSLKGLFQYWMRVIIIGISRDIEYDLRNDLFGHLVELSQDFYSRYRTGDIMARSTNDLNAVRMMLGPGIMYWTETSVMLILAVIVMAHANLQLTLIALSPAPLVSVAVIFFGRKIHARFEHIQSMFSDISSKVQENLAGVRVVRAYAQEEAEVEQFERLNREYIRENIGLARIQGAFMPLLQALIGVTFLLVLWAGGRQLMQGKISLGSFVMFNTYMGMLIWPMIAFGWVINLMQRGTASLNRINEMIHQRPSIARPEGEVLQPSQYSAEVGFRHVSMRFGTREALNDIKLLVHSGETIAIVGHTGSGKTTLVSLIARMMDPTSGTVTFGGVDLRKFDPEDLRRQIGFVPQETFLFSATLAENIAWGVPDASIDQIRWAAGVAGLTTDIEGFPNGLDTVIGERGLTLSGGQKQRTAIARAILRNPRILILDDALSSVDTVTEEKILKSLATVMRDRTTILISHRVSTVQNAHRIIVLSHGSVVEIGTHEELQRRGGYYAELYQKQLLEEELEAI
ncbi:MAG: ABC transporter ATP-binding protein [Acidobacteriaceae bacterium]|nr:ABC transporter ATP-binding protein [Acidobacteriaceae bacterium]MBV9937530.1 ABC transporter ATP-binding protein [Acidobacteriaceae bacterium]